MLKAFAGALLGLIVFTGGAMAQSCSGATYTVLTNGQAADANQVMGNFTCVLSSPTFAGPVGVGGSTTAPFEVYNGSGGYEGYITGGGSNVTRFAVRNQSAQGMVELDIGGGGSPYAILQTGVTNNIPLELAGSTVTVAGTSGGGNCVYSGGSGWSCSSDERLKTNVASLATQYGLAAIDQLQPVSYNLKGDHDHMQLGFIAQNVARIVPQAATFDKRITSSLTPDGQFLVNYTALIPPAVLAIQQLDARTSGISAAAEDNNRQIAELKEEVRKLTEELAIIKHATRTEAR